MPPLHEVEPGHQVACWVDITVTKPHEIVDETLVKTASVVDLSEVDLVPQAVGAGEPLETVASSDVDQVVSRIDVVDKANREAQ
jgi:hypothetical protein